MKRKAVVDANGNDCSASPKRAKLTKRKYIASPVKQAIVNAIQSGRSVSAVARDFQTPQQTVDNIWKRFQERGTVRRAEKAGRPRKSTPRMDKLIKRISFANPLKTAADISELRQHYGVSLDVSTVNRRLNDAGLYGRHAAKKPLVSQKNRKARLAFARRHVNWTPDQWRKVLFSDESKFELFRTAGVTYVRRPIACRNDVRYQVPTVKHGGGSVLVWGCFSSSGVGPLIQIQGTLDQVQYRSILEDSMLPHARETMPQGWIFQQDNDPKHTAKTVKAWFRRHRVRVLEWPSQSPDLNPIEHLWDELGRRANAQKCTNLRDLFGLLQREWAAIPQHVIDTLIDSMPRRCASVIKAKGFSTKY